MPMTTDQSRLAADVDTLYHGARAVYVGRTNHPQRRLLEHALEPAGHTHLSVLWWSEDWRAVAAMERALVTHLVGRGKGSNIDRESDGKWRAAWNCIYVLWTPKNGARLVGPVQSVDRLVSMPSRHAALTEPVHFALGDSLRVGRRPSAVIDRAAVEVELGRWATRPAYRPPTHAPGVKPPAVKPKRSLYHAFLFNTPDQLPDVSAATLRALHDKIRMASTEHDAIKYGLSGASLSECRQLTDYEKQCLNKFCGPDDGYA